MKKKKFFIIFKLFVVAQIIFFLIGCGGSEEKKSFYINGNLKEKFFVKQIDGNFLKHGQYTSWHQNGMKETKGQFVKGKFDGHWESWYADGTKAMDRYFNEGIKSGEWKHYGDTYKSTINYKDDLLNGKVEASLNLGFPKLTIKVEFKNGIPINNFFIKKWEDMEDKDDFWKDKDFDYFIKGQFSSDGKAKIIESNSFKFEDGELYLKTERTGYRFSRGFKQFFYSDYGIGEAIRCFGSGFFDTILSDSIAESEQNY